jgi:transcriptional regulator with XRE-family HTH domain
MIRFWIDPRSSNMKEAIVAAEDVFWNDLREDLQDPEFLREYVAQWVRVSTTDSIINSLDEARIEAGLSKAALARAINTDPAALRRLLGKSRSNPTLGTVAELAAALGMRVTLEPLNASERQVTTAPLLEGRVEDSQALVSKLGAPALV